jgi:hypothetical protein
LKADEVWAHFTSSAGWRNGSGRYEAWRGALHSRMGAILPRVGEQKELNLYLLAENPGRLRILRDIARQVFGDVWLNLGDRSDPVLSPRDSFEEHLGVLGVGAAVRVGVKPTHGPQVAAALNLLGESIAAQPDTELSGPGGIGAAIRSYQAAIELGDIALAHRLLDEMAAYGLIEAHNIAFLRLWGVAKADPESLLRVSGVEDVLAHRQLPAALLRTVADAILSVVERQGEGGEWLPDFWESRAGLGRALCGLSDRRGASLRVVATALDEEPKASSSDIALAEEEGSIPVSLTRAARKVLRRQPSSRETAPSVAALANEETSKEVIVQLLKLALTDPAAVIALQERCLDVEFGLLEQWKIELPILSQVVSGSEKEEILPNEPEVSTWLTWLRQLESSGQDCPSPSTWGSISLVSLDAQNGEWKELAVRLDGVRGLESTRVLQALPGITLAWGRARGEEGARAIVKPMLELAAECYMESAGALASRGALTELYSLFEVVADLEFEKAEYEDAVGFLGAAIEDSKTVGVLPGAVDILELFLDSKCPSEEALDSLARVIAQTAMRFTKRLDADTRCLLQMLLQELELEAEGEALTQVAVPAGTAEAETPEVSLAEVKIGIYSLEAGSLNRAKAILQDVYLADIIVNSDKTATEALRGMCSSCDAVVMVKRAAQHAATDEIRKLVPTDQLILPHGKGSSSIIRETLHWAASGA